LKISWDTIHSILPYVEKPGRYSGGEPGCIIKENPSYSFALSFPDLYEIGMSNQAMRILYSQINSIEDVQCERVFAPAPDMEEQLKNRGVPLFSLETRKPVKDFDLLGFTVGYELSLTNIFTILASAHIPIEKNKRTAHDPIILLGGPAVTNPAPFGDFVEGVFIGEAEDGLTELVKNLKELKNKGGTRADAIDLIQSHSSIWFQGKKGRTIRSVWTEFPNQKEDISFPVATLRPVQDHGAVEIMRGCPQGCRFCHAGLFYRPFRAKSYQRIDHEIYYNVFTNGYRDITLTSLSTGDYPGVIDLITKLNKRYNSLGVSFGLPSLRVDSLTLPLIEEVSRVKKSGLTFAIETPKKEWQQGLNKIVPIEKTIDLLKTAKDRGWKLAKFYFMIGLPTSDSNEIQEIVKYLKAILQEVNIRINVNVGVFIPKPHTPFQQTTQMEPEVGFQRIMELKNEVKGFPIKVNYHDPFQSLLEGIIARGTSSAGQLFYQAWLEGARLDAWDEYFNKPLWRKVVEQASWNVISDTCSPLKAPLPWEGISLGITNKYVESEHKKSQEGVLTELCSSDCTHHCGLCKHDIGVAEPVISEIPQEVEEAKPPIPLGEEIQYFLVNYTRLKSASYISHLNLLHLFEKLLFGLGLTPAFTEGYHPKPKLQFARPLPIGVESESEWMIIQLRNNLDVNRLGVLLNSKMPEGMAIKGVHRLQKGERKLPSLMAIHKSSVYRIDRIPDDRISELKDSLMKEWNFSQSQIREEGSGTLIITQEVGQQKGNPPKWLRSVGGEEFWQWGIVMTKVDDYLESKKDYPGGFPVIDSWTLPKVDP